MNPRIVSVASASLVTLAVGAFGPWATRVGAGVNTRQDEIVGIVAAVAAAALGLAVVTRMARLAIIPLLAGLSGVALLANDVADPAGPFGGPGPNIEIDWGLWATFGGSIGLALASLLLVLHVGNRPAAASALPARLASGAHASVARAARLRSRTLDRMHGIRTEAFISLDRFGLDHPERVAYVPSPWRTPRRVLGSFHIGPSDVFVDIGSGLGRVMYVAARHGFARVEGVELSEELADQARENLRRANRHIRAADVRVVTADVLEYELPDDATFIYCFNPFKGELFQALLDKVLASLDRRPRLLRLIYLNPLEHERVLATGRARLVRIQHGSRLLPGPREPHTAHVYELH